VAAADGVVDSCGDNGAFLLSCTTRRGGSPRGGFLAMVLVGGGIGLAGVNSCVGVVVRDRDSSLVVAPDCEFRRREGEVGAVGSRKKVRGLGEGKLDGLPWARRIRGTLR
jgi:hypothetical protein